MGAPFRTATGETARDIDTLHSTVYGDGPPPGPNFLTATQGPFVGTVPAVDPKDGRVILVTLSGATPIANPVNPVQGQSLQYIFSGTGNATWGNAFATTLAGPSGPGAVTVTFDGALWQPIALNPASVLASPVTIPGTVNAPNSYRLVGATATGVPTSGAFTIGDKGESMDGLTEWLCTQTGVFLGFSGPALALNPKVYLRLDDTGTNLADSSGNGNNGSISASDVTRQVPSLLTGDPNTATSFGGTSGYGSITSLDLTGTSIITVAFSLNWTTFANNDKLAYEFSTNVNSSAGGFLADPNGASGQFEVSCRNGTNLHRVKFTRPSAGVAHRYVFVYDMSANPNVITVYLDGQPVATTVISTGTVAHAFGNLPLYLMSRAGTSLFGAGTQDEFLIYPFGFSAAQALADYNNSNAPIFATTAHLTGTETFSGAKTFSQPLGLQQYTDYLETAPPATPAAGHDRTWFDSATGALTVIKSNGQAMRLAAGTFVTPRDYGGIGDGSADDTAALNSTYNAGGEGLTYVPYISGGNWKYSSQLNWTVVKNFLIQGAGSGVTFLKPTAFGGSSLKLSGHTTFGGVMQNLKIFGPGTYAFPNTNPSNSAGVDGVEIAPNIVLNFVAMELLGTGLVINFGGGGGHQRVNNCFFNQNYYSLRYDNSGLDDHYLNCEFNNAMFSHIEMADACPPIDVTGTRSHFTAAPFAVHQSSTSTGNGFISGLEGFHLGCELLGNGWLHTEKYATVNYAVNLLKGWFGGMSASTGQQRRSDKPGDYWIVMNSTNTYWEVHASQLKNMDKGFLYSHVGPGTDMHFYGLYTDLVFVMGDASDGHAIRWHSNALGTYQGTATFAAASGNGATKAIGANSWPGPPTSLSLLLSDDTDGGLTNSFNIVRGTVTSSPTLVAPLAPVAALVTIAGNVDAGPHSYRGIFKNGGLNGRAGTTALGTVSNAVTADASHAQVTVTLPTNGVTPAGSPTVTMDLYRTKAGQDPANLANYFLHTAGIALGTLSITDNTADASLGAAGPTVDSTAGWQATCTLKTTAGQTGNPTFAYALKNQ